MRIEQVEILGKRLHQFAEAFQAACIEGDGFEAYLIIGRLSQTIPELKVVARTVHENATEIMTTAELMDIHPS